MTKHWYDFLQTRTQARTRTHHHTFNSLCSVCWAGEADDREQSKLEEKLWDPECPLSSKQIDQFLVVARYDL